MRLHLFLQGSSRWLISYGTFIPCATSKHNKPYKTWLLHLKVSTYPDNSLMGAYSYLVSFIFIYVLLLSQFSYLGIIATESVSELSSSKSPFYGFSYKLKMGVVPDRLDMIPPPPAPTRNTPDFDHPDDPSLPKPWSMLLSLLVLEIKCLYIYFLLI